MRRLIYITIIITIAMASIGYSQNADNTAYYSLQDLIPTNKNIYYIGEFHIDNETMYKEGPWRFTTINTATSIEDSIRQILSRDCNVKTYVLESPVSNEYFYKKYFSSGDEEWLNACESGEYQKNKIRSLRKIALENEDIKIRCIDTDEKKYSAYTMNCLFLMTFFDNYDEENHFSRTSVYADTAKYSDRSYADEIWRNKLIYNDTIRRFIMHIYKLSNEFSLTKSRRLYKLLADAKMDTVLQTGLRNYYQDDYDYFVRLTNSYLNSYDLKYNGNKTKLYWKQRETILQNNFTAILNADTTTSYCLQIGAAHVLPNSFFENTCQYISASLQLPSYYFVMLPQYFNCSACTGIENVDFHFEGLFRYEKVLEDGMYYILK